MFQVHGEEEWSFGYCEEGSGVFSCPSGKNPMYTYRECIVLGKTNCSILKVAQILRELSREWPGQSYDLLSKNCNHFCDEFCQRLGVPRLPGKCWPLKQLDYFHEQNNAYIHSCILLTSMFTINKFLLGRLYMDIKLVLLSVLYLTAQNVICVIELVDMCQSLLLAYIEK